MVFPKKKLLLVIILTSAALVGILTVQDFGIDAAVETQKEQFDRQIATVSEGLEEAVESDTVFQKPMLDIIEIKNIHSKGFILSNKS